MFLGLKFIPILCLMMCNVYYYNICSYIKIRVLLRFNFNFVHQQHIFDVYIYRAVSTIRSNLPSYQIVMQTVKNIDSGKIEISLTIPPSSIFNAYEWYLLIRLWIERLNENRERIQTIKNSHFLIAFWIKNKNLSIRPQMRYWSKWHFKILLSLKIEKDYKKVTYS